MAKSVLSNEHIAQQAAAYARALREIDQLTARNRKLQRDNTMLAKALSKEAILSPTDYQESNG